MRWSKTARNSILYPPRVPHFFPRFNVPERRMRLVDLKFKSDRDDDPEASLEGTQVHTPKLRPRFPPQPRPRLLPPT